MIFYSHNCGAISIVVLLLIFLKLHLSITIGEAVIFKIVNLMSCPKMEAETELS